MEQNWGTGGSSTRINRLWDNNRWDIRRFRRSDNVSIKEAGVTVGLTIVIPGLNFLKGPLSLALGAVGFLGTNLIHWEDSGCASLEEEGT